MPPLPGPARPLVRDVGLAVGVAAVSLVYAYSDITTMALVLALCAPLAVRRAFPRVALAAWTIAALAHVAVLEDPTVSIIAVPILLYSLARWSTTAIARAALGIALAGSIVGPARWLTNRPEPLTFAGVATTVAAYAAIVVAVFIAARRTREREERQAQRARDRADAAAAEERNEVARDVHDIVAHSLSVIAIQAEGGRALTTRHPERAPEILEVIAETSRAALDDIRELVALLRRDGRPGLRPVPGLGDVEDLVARLGGRARLRIVGDRCGVSPVVGLTVYRVVQESLTNVLRHAGPSAGAEVTLEVTDHAVDVTVRDNGRGAASASDGRGVGLAAMRERVQLHDGTLTSGPQVGGGFEVHAVLPMRSPLHDRVVHA